jgi:hypothetical protein
MTNIIQQIEQCFILFGVFLFKTIFFFLDDVYQSLLVSFVHYTVFIIGFYYFIISNPKSNYRIYFFAFVLFSMACYFAFNRCVLTQVEFFICPTNNKIQQTIAHFFGEQLEGNLSSKLVLTAMTIVTGIMIVHDL